MPLYFANLPYLPHSWATTLSDIAQSRRGDLELVEHLEIMHVRLMYIYVAYFALGGINQLINFKE